MTRRTHKTTEGIGFDDVWNINPPVNENDDSIADAEVVADVFESDEDHDSHTAKIALGVSALGLLGIASAVAYRNLRKHHKEGDEA